MLKVRVLEWPWMYKADIYHAGRDPLTGQAKGGKAKREQVYDMDLVDLLDPHVHSEMRRDHELVAYSE